MNNYCTNCGNKLNKNDLVCQNCNTPIIDLPYNYIYKSPQKKRINKIIIISLSILVSLIILIILGYILKINVLKTKYVEKYILDNYPNQKYTIKYNSSGKCIVSGNCYYNWGSGCDQNSCDEYKYLNRFKCRSYYYNVKIDKKNFIITVFRKGLKYSVVEGKNIYGIKEDDEYEDNENIDINNNDKGNADIIIDKIQKYPYESNYYNFNNGTTNNQITLSDNNIMWFFTGILESNSNIYISGHISNPNYNSGNILMHTKYYDKDYNEIGICDDDIQLLGKGYSNIAFSCNISQNDIKNNKLLSAVKYYKIFIDEFNIM